MHDLSNTEDFISLSHENKEIFNEKHWNELKPMRSIAFKLKLSQLW